MVGAAAHGEPAQQAALAEALARRGVLALRLARVRVGHGAGRGARRVAGGRPAALADAATATAATATAPGAPPPLVAQGAGLAQGGAQLPIAPGALLTLLIGGQLQLPVRGRGGAPALLGAQRAAGSIVVVAAVVPRPGPHPRLVIDFAGRGVEAGDLLPGSLAPEAVAAVAAVAAVGRAVLRGRGVLGLVVVAVAAGVVLLRRWQQLRLAVAAQVQRAVLPVHGDGPR